MKQTYMKRLNKTVNLSDVKLPPVWVNNSKNGASIASENQNGFFLSGPNRELANHLIQLINNAEKTVVLSSFLLADDELENAIYNASERGVRVYIMLACETRLEGDTPDDDFGKMCLDQHVKMLKRLGGKVSFRSASHFHSKVVLVDALDDNGSKAQGVLLTANLTKEALGRNDELAVELTSPEISDTVRLLKWAMFEYAEHELLDGKSFSAVNPLNCLSFPKNLNRILNTSNKNNTIREQALKIIEAATSELVVASFGWQEDHEVVNAICKKAQQGIRVLILARIRPSSMAALMKLAASGAQVLGFKWLHAKAIWNDKNEAMMMSANLQKHGLDEGFEIGLFIEGKRGEQLKSCLDSLYLQTTKHIKTLKLNTVLSEHLGEIEYWENKTFNKVTVDKEVRKVLDSITADCLTDLNKDIEVPKLSWKKMPVHNIEYSWTVNPPVLPKNAKEELWSEKVEIVEKVPDIPSENKDKKKVKTKPKYKTITHSYEPKVFRHKGRVLIAINAPEELQMAVKLKEQKFSNAEIVLGKQR